MITAIALILTVAIANTPPTANAAASSTYNGSGFNYDWETVRVGAGGFITGISIANDGTIVSRADVYGGYKWTGTTNQQLLTSASMPAAYVTTESGEGVHEIAIAPSDSSRIYMYWRDRVFISSDGGTTFTEGGFGSYEANPNEQSNKHFNDKVTVDPINPDVVYVGTPSNGMFVSFDAGATFTAVTSVPAGTSTRGVAAITFDPYSGDTAGRTNTIYASSEGNGLYKSDDAGVTWALVSGAPSLISDIAVRSDSTIYVVDGANNGSAEVYEYDGIAWSDIQVSFSGSGQAGAAPWSLAIDPGNDDRLFVINRGGRLGITTDGGATWVSGSLDRSATDVPWLEWTAETYFSAAEIELNPANTSELWIAQGLGLWKIDVSTNPSGTHTWVSQNDGIEEIVTNDLLSLPGSNRLILGTWDRQIFTTTDISQYPTQHAPNDTFNNAWDLDYSISDPDYVVAHISDHAASRGAVLNSSYSTDGGATWQSFATKPGPVTATNALDWGLGGNIAVGAPNNTVIIPSSDKQAYYTTDGGSTWNPTNGLPVDMHSGYFLRRRVLTSDPLIAGTFYAYHDTNGVYRSTDSGANWTLIGASPTLNGGFNAKMKATPGVSGELYLTSGPVGQKGSLPLDSGESFYRSTDSGATWTAIPNMTEVRAFGFGVTVAGQSYPSIYAAGFNSGVYGVWRSYDIATTWEQIGDFPLESISDIDVVVGDKNTQGCVYVGLGGNGWGQGCEVATANSAPVITSDGGAATASLNVNENQTAVTTVAATDADIAQTITYTITGGADSAAFTISGDVITFSSAPDFENPTDTGVDNTYELIMTATDNASPTTASDSQTITVTVVDVIETPGNSAPTALSLTSNTIAENTAAQTFIGTLLTTDADSGDTHSYRFVSGSGSEDNVLFGLYGANTDSLGFKTSPNFELPRDTNADNQYQVRLETSDGNGGTLTQAFTISVTNDTSDDAATEDTDGIDNTVEDAAPNNGDYNGDGIADSTQSNVASIPMIASTSQSSPYIGLQSSASSSITSLTNNNESTLGDDLDYTYPIGLVSFSLSVPVGSSQQVTLFLDQEYPETDTANWIWRKYSSADSSFSNVPASANLTYGTATVGSEQITTVSYTLNDGGTLDEDAAANGTIVDPIGPAVLTDADGDSLAETGVQTHAVSIIGGVIGLAAICTSYVYKKNKPVYSLTRKS